MAREGKWSWGRVWSKSEEEQLVGFRGKRRHRGNLLCTSTCTKHVVAGGLVCQLTSSRMTGDDLKLCQERFRLGIREVAFIWIIKCYANRYFSS